jgi:hypothetical protein
MIAKRILLTSLPRSGSTWVLKMLSVQPRVLSVHEPDHLDVVGIGNRGMHPYVNEHNESSPYYEMYAKIFRGQALPIISGGQSIHRILRRLIYRHYLVLRSLSPVEQTLIIKSVFSLHNTEWIYRNFSPTVVIVLRHPCSVIHSIHRKWPNARLKEPHSQTEFVRDYLGAHKELLKGAESTFGVLSSRLAAYYSAVLGASRRHPSWIVVTHEQLCADPIGEFRRLYDKLELDWDGRVETAIHASNQPKKSDEVHHVNRVSAKEIGKWKALLSEKEIAEIGRYYCPFEIPYYTDLCR